jgi:tetratricopeptide (TPR) repeat protein
MGALYVYQNNFEDAIDCFNKGLIIWERLDHQQFRMNTLLNLGGAYVNVEKYDLALEYTLKAKEGYLEMHNLGGVAGAYNNIGRIRTAQGDYLNAIKSYESELKIMQEIDQKEGVLRSLGNIGFAHLNSGNYSKAIRFCEQSYGMALQLELLYNQKINCECLYEAYQKKGDYKRSLDYFEESVKLKDSILSEENQRETIRTEYQYEYDKQALSDSLEFAKAEAIKDLEIEKQQAELSQQRIGLAASGIGLILIIALAVSIYRGKKRSDELLLNILPEETAQELKAKGSAESKLIEDTTVLFTDFEGFTAMSENITASALVKDINECFSAFDHIMEKHGVEKIKTIGDA